MDDTGEGDTGARSERFRSKKLCDSGKYVYEDRRRSLNDATVMKTAKETGSKGISKILRGDMHEGRIEDEDEGMAQRQPGKSRRRRQQKEELKGKN